MFGKSLSEYVAFQKPILILIAAVWAEGKGFGSSPPSSIRRRPAA